MDENVSTPPTPDKHPRCASAALLILVAEGDHGAYTQLYRIHRGSIQGTTSALLRDTHQAEEVTQEVLLQIWQQASRFDPGRGTATAWIMQIARARAIDRIRGTQAARVRDHRHAHRNTVTDFDAVTETALLHLDVAQLHQALMAVTVVQREALVLAFFSDRSYPEIAADLGLPLSTLKTRIRDGLIRIRKDLAGHLADSEGVRETVAA